MTQTLRRERRKRFEDVLETFGATPKMTLGISTDEKYYEWRTNFVNARLDAAESRTEKLTPEDYAAVDKKMDAILKQEAEAQSRTEAGTGWRGRELLAPEHLIYGDWWHAKTGLHMYGAKAKAKLDTGWAKAFKELYENDVTIAALNEAYTANEWRTVSNPAQIVSDAKAMQAAPVKVQDTNSRPELQKFTPQDTTEFIPRPK